MRTNGLTTKYLQGVISAFANTVDRTAAAKLEESERRKVTHESEHEYKDVGDLRANKVEFEHHRTSPRHEDATRPGGSASVYQRSIHCNDDIHMCNSDSDM